MIWRLHESHAHLQSGPWRAFVDLSQPSRGLYGWQRDHTNVWSDALRTLQVHLPDLDASPIPLREAFVRGHDLVASFGPTPAQRFAPQLYWRQWSQGESHGVEVLVSLQTDLLDSQPQLQVTSIVPADEIWGLPTSTSQQLVPFAAVATTATARETMGSWLLFRGKHSDFSYVEMVHPGDFHQVTVREEGNSRVSSWLLFPERLEKGVIRRGRLQCAFVPRQDDVAEAIRLYEAFCAADIPLTA